MEAAEAAEAAEAVPATTVQCKMWGTLVASDLGVSELRV